MSSHDRLNGPSHNAREIPSGTIDEKEIVVNDINCSVTEAKWTKLQSWLHECIAFK